MNPWELTTLLIANALVSAFFGWLGAKALYSNLSFRVSEMEAAVAHYWDRIRKRMRVEPHEDYKPSAPARLTDQEILRRAGVDPLGVPTGEEIGHRGA